MKRAMVALKGGPWPVVACAALSCRAPCSKGSLAVGHGRELFLLLEELAEGGLIGEIQQIGYPTDRGLGGFRQFQGAVYQLVAVVVACVGQNGL